MEKIVCCEINATDLDGVQSIAVTFKMFRISVVPMKNAKKKNHLLIF